MRGATLCDACAAAPDWARFCAIGAGAPGREGKSAEGGARVVGAGNAAAAAVLMAAGGTPVAFEAFAVLAEAAGAGCFFEGRCGLGSSVTARGAQRLAIPNAWKQFRQLLCCTQTCMRNLSSGRQSRCETTTSLPMLAS